MVSIVELVQELSLQVACVGRVGFGVENCGHLEQEDFVGRLLSPIHLATRGVQQVAIFEELAGEATKYEDILVVSLDNAATLSIGEVLLRDVDQSPFASILVVKLFDRVDVLTSLVGDTTESVHISVTESAGAVVVSADIEFCYLEPQVDVTVVHLTLELRLVLFFSRSSDNDELFSEPAG